jgi:hypothetical protein
LEATIAMNVTDQSVWTEHITARAARNVARELKKAGYKSATRQNCRGYIINVAQYFEPGDVEARQILLRLICEAAGIQPKNRKSLIAPPVALPAMRTEMKVKVILSTKLIIGDGTFVAENITKTQAQAWVDDGGFENFCGHETVRILSIEPSSHRGNCNSYDEALAITPKSRLEFGREYSIDEIESIGVSFTLIRKIE